MPAVAVAPERCERVSLNGHWSADSLADDLSAAKRCHRHLTDEANPSLDSGVRRRAPQSVQVSATAGYVLPLVSLRYAILHRRLTDLPKFGWVKPGRFTRKTR